MQVQRAQQCVPETPISENGWEGLIPGMVVARAHGFPEPETMALFGGAFAGLPLRAFEAYEPQGFSRDVRALLAALAAKFQAAPPATFHDVIRAVEAFAQRWGLWVDIHRGVSK